MKSEHVFMTASSELGKYVLQWVVMIGDKIVTSEDDKINRDYVLKEFATIKYGRL